MAKQRYGEGDWFAVPLGSLGYAVGVVARIGSLTFGFFFGPARSTLPTIDDVRSLHPDDAVVAGRFGALGLRGGRWPVLGRLDDWDRDQWSMPPLIRHEADSGRTFAVTYDDDDPGRLVGEVFVETSAADERHRDGVMGDGFVEKPLARKFGLTDWDRIGVGRSRQCP